MAEKNQHRLNVYLSLGTNLGNRLKNLAEAENHIRSIPGIRIKKVSSVYETSPVGPKQKKFLNSAMHIQTGIPPQRLLSVLKFIERKMQRRKTSRWGPRKIDLDIISYGRKKMRGSRLTLPHPEFHRRKFVLVPLGQIAPHFKPAGFRHSISSLSRHLTDPKQKVTLFNVLS